MESAIHTYDKGLNQDIAKSKYSPDNYFTASNIRVVSDEATSTLSITNEKGFTQPFKLRYSDHTILGFGQLRNYLIIVSAAGSLGTIWKVNINPDGTTDDLDIGNMLSADTIVYMGGFDFSTDRRPEVWCNYETPEVGKVYIVDSGNFWHINVLDPTISTKPLSALKLVPEVTFGNIGINIVNSGGDYSSGMVQYAYQYYNLHGSQSSFSAPTGLLHLTDSPENLASAQKYYGSPVDTSTNKSVLIKITGIDTRFTNIRVVSIFYNKYNVTPIINIIEDRTITSSTSTITVIDNGTSTRGTLQDVEFTGLGSVDFKCKTATVKDNMMFVSNIEEEFFDIGDFDTRTYRYTKTLTCNVKDDNGTILPVTNWASVPATHDCIQNKEDQYNYKYNKGGTLGGEGTNFKYTFGVTSVVEDIYGFGGDSRLGGGVANYEYTNYASSKLHAEKIGYQRDEVYRFFAIYKDEKGRKSFPSWIADIKMPAMYETDTKEVYTTPGGKKYDFNISYQGQYNLVYINILHPIFTVRNLPTGAVSCEIVRVKREDYDKTILSQGPIFASKLYNDKYYANEYITVAATQLTGATRSKILRFVSPDVAFTKNIVDGTLMRPVFKSSLYSHVNGGVNPGGSVSSIIGFFYKTHTPIPFTKTTNNILEKRVVTNSYEQSVSFTNLSEFYYHWCSGLGDLGSRAGISMMCIMEKQGITVPSEGWGDICIANIEQDLSAQYGGSTYTARSVNKCISCGTTISQTNTETSVYGGDIYLGYFDYLYSYADSTSSTTYLQNLYVLVESSINLALRHDRPVSKDTSGNYWLMREDAGNHTTEGGTVFYNQVSDLYLYNTVYSKESDINIYSPKPINFSSNRKFDCRVLGSGVKVINEEIDSWTSYLAANYIDLEGTYGPVTKLTTYQNRVYFLQEKAFGWLNVNERALITPDQTGTSLSLGKGGVLDQSFYISRNSGTKHQFSVITTPAGIYWFDVLNSRINLFNGENAEPLSEVKGISSTLKNLRNTDLRKYDLTLNGTGVHSIYDSEFNRILWTFLGIPEEFTISYNEKLQAFESFYSFMPRIYGVYEDKVYSTSTTDKPTCHLHNSGAYGDFYYGVYDSSITVLFNKDTTITKLITNLEYYLQTASGDKNLDYIRVYNDYQDTQRVSLTSENSGRRMRTWRYTIPRNYGSDDRIRSENCFIELGFTNSVNKKFNLYDLIVHYIVRPL